MIKKTLRKIYYNLPIIRELESLRRVMVTDAEANQKLLAYECRRRIIEGEGRLRGPKRLARFGYQINSQNDEDGIIQEIFKRIGTANKIFVEIGVGDGLENNTAYLYSQGWTGYWIDGDGKFLKTLKNNSVPESSIRGMQSYVSKENIESVLIGLGVPAEIDLFSLDIDQNTLHVWRGIKNFRPRVWVIEYNSIIPPDIEWEVEYDPTRVWDGTHAFGGSLKSFEQTGRELGYSLVGCDITGVNAFFVRDDLIANHFEEPYTSENHYEPPRLMFTPRLTHPRGTMHPSRSR